MFLTVQNLFPLPLLDLRVHRALKDPKELLVLKEQLVHKGLRATSDHRVHRGRKEVLVLKDHRATLDLRVMLVHKAHKVHRDRRA